jgi:hypothetical protein
LRQYYADNIESDTLNFTDNPLKDVQSSNAFIGQPSDLSQFSEFPVPNLTNSATPNSDFTTFLHFLSENKTLEFHRVAAFNSTLPKLIDTHTAIYVYTAFILGSIFITSIRSMFFFKVCMTASKILHDTMFGCILAATMRFFDTNSSGKHCVKIMYFYMVYICSMKIL